jgi:hypothetical protein
MENNCIGKQCVGLCVNPIVLLVVLYISPPPCSQSILGWKHSVPTVRVREVLALQLLTPLFWWARLSLYVWLIKFQKEWQSTMPWSYYLDNLEYTIYSKKYESTRVAFIWYNSPVIKIQNIPLMTHHDFPRWESGLSDILASIFQCTSELGLWIINIHRTLHVL